MYIFSAVIRLLLNVLVFAELLIILFGFSHRGFGQEQRHASSTASKLAKCLQRPAANLKEKRSSAPPAANLDEWSTYYTKFSVITTIREIQTVAIPFFASIQIRHSSACLYSQNDATYHVLSLISSPLDLKVLQHPSDESLKSTVKILKDSFEKLQGEHEKAEKSWEEGQQTEKKSSMNRKTAKEGGCINSDALAEYMNKIEESLLQLCTMKID